MAEAVPVRCPACLRENSYTVPVYPCACGGPVHPPLDLAAPPEPLTHRTWSETWVTVRCEACGRESEWPHPEVGCGSCGTVVLIAVHPAHPAHVDHPDPTQPDSAAEPAGTGDGSGGSVEGSGAEPASGGGTARPGARPGPRPEAHRDGPRDRPPATQAPLPSATPVPRPAFRPVTIRTARDAVATAALYLRWLGFQDVRQPDGRPIPSAAVDLRAPGLVAQVDPTTAPAGLRAVECVWLNGLTASATAVYFSLAGYTKDARTRADDLGIPLFVMDLTGMPQPVNDPADALVGSGA